MISNIVNIKSDVTLLIIKYHIVYEKKHWKILDEIENYGLKINLVKRIYFDNYFYRKFYLHLQNQIFYESLCLEYSKGDVFVVIVSGKNVIQFLREIIGPTDPLNSNKEQLRGKYGKTICLNAVHASENYKDYLHEIKLIKNYENKS